MTMLEFIIDPSITYVVGCIIGFAFGVFFFKAGKRDTDE